MSKEATFTSSLAKTLNGGKCKLEEMQILRQKSASPANELHFFLNLFIWKNSKPTEYSQEWYNVCPYTLHLDVTIV